MLSRNIARAARRFLIQALLCMIAGGGAAVFSGCGRIHTFGGIEHEYDYSFDDYGHHHHKKPKKHHKKHKKHHRHHHHDD